MNQYKQQYESQLRKNNVTDPPIQKQEQEISKQKDLQPQVDQIQCIICNKIFDYEIDFDKTYQLRSCQHWYCNHCLRMQIRNEYMNKPEFTCVQCSIKLDSDDIEHFIEKEKIPLKKQKLREKQQVECIKCQKMSQCNESKFECSGCNLIQCKNCKCTPYHEGMTCQIYKVKQKQIHCRYCSKQIILVDKYKPSVLHDICNEFECLEKCQYACLNRLSCKHPCGGFRDETKCECIQEECIQDKNQQSANDYCSICLTETLGQGPCTKSQCGHIFHYLCVLKKLEMKWTGPRISFNFCNCTLCNQWMCFEQESEQQELMEKYVKMKEDIERKAVQRLKYEMKDQDERLTNSQSIYYQKPLEYAMSIYAYYECYQCTNIYFGGTVNCQLQEDNQDVNEKELLCPKCLNVEECKLHGLEYIEYKCKFCCNKAVYFCWGKTHFCQKCHERQMNKDYVTKIPKEKLPKCAGKFKCPLRMEHRPNGEEQSLGCALCRKIENNI